ncbi:hypothetical protein [Microbacterium sp.]|uniref:hypothetical protein n=1 Tax=Microbacterium sp. TaxID=51671 RepID=UPI00391BE0C5
MTWVWKPLAYSGGHIHTEPDLVVWREIAAVGEDPLDGSTIRLQVRYGDKLGRYYIAGFALGDLGESNEVTGARLRDMPILSHLRDALDGYAEVMLSTGDSFDPLQVSAARSEIIDGGPSSREAMLATARVYRYAQILNLSPAFAVQTTLGLTAPTATLWIRRARSQGLLGTYGQTDG